MVPPSDTSRYLRVDERIYIADRLREKASVRAMAAELGCSPSTVSRERSAATALVPRGDQDGDPDGLAGQGPPRPCRGRYALGDDPAGWLL
ncbi:helix-turn-helix domain-containing protein [Streptomyces sp. NPDC058441]|uniref:helix-turn-helix domain-containing protein n=1 Tax=Streptomyces sp. NPDC058441 TaxID=3346502 RepID=UPI00365AEAC7